MTNSTIVAHLNGTTIKHRMVDLGIPNLRALAEKSGVDYTSLCKAMTQDREPSKAMFLRLSVALDVSLDQLIRIQVESEKAAA